LSPTKGGVHTYPDSLLPIGIRAPMATSNSSTCGQVKFPHLTGS